MGIANCFLIGFKVLSTAGNHAWYCSPGQDPRAGVGLNGCTVSLLTFILQTRVAVTGEASCCSGQQLTEAKNRRQVAIECLAIKTAHDTGSPWCKGADGVCVQAIGPVVSPWDHGLHVPWREYNQVLLERKT